MTNNWNPFMQSFPQTMNLEGFTESQRKMYENARAASEAMMNCMGKAYQQQNEMMQSSMQESVEASKAMANAKGIEDLMKFSSEYTKRSMENVSRNANQLTEIYRQCSTECTDICQKAANENMNIWSSNTPTQQKSSTSTAAKK